MEHLYAILEDRGLAVEIDNGSAWARSKGATIACLASTPKDAMSIYNDYMMGLLAMGEGICKI